MISKGISEISCDKHEFEKAKDVYNEALEKSGYNQKLKYQKQHVNRFPAPYSKHIKINIEKIFMKLISKHFPKQHKYYKIFNKNAIKLSYSCMPNMSSIITKHNKTFLNKKVETEERKCNCRDKTNCPMEGKCLTKCIVHKASVSSLNEAKHYLGTAENEFKTRYSNHKTSFKNRTHGKDIELSKYIWTKI